MAEVLPLFGFYLQPAVGGRVLDEGFWRRFLEIGPVVAIKVAPFNRYQTLDVVRALAESGRGAEVALYTGNDDAIVADLLAASSRLGARAGPLRRRPPRPVGGLDAPGGGASPRGQGVPADRQGAFDLLALGQQLTDANAALFDARHGFAGCIAGIHEVLRRQGLLAGRWCLDPREDLSPGQEEEIDRVLRAYPHLTDDEFVAENLERWLS